MNRGRKIKHSLSIKNEENISSSPKNEATSAAASKHITPCRRMGLNRKRKNVSGSSSELNISSPNNSLTEIDISVNDFTSDANKINLETPVLKKNVKPRNNSLGARKRFNRTPNTTNSDALSSEETLKKYKHLYNIISDVCVVLTRCDFDKHILSRNNVRESSADIENEAISSTPVEANNSEIQTNQISTTVEEDATIAENNKNQIEVRKKNVEVAEKNVEVTEKNVEVTEKNVEVTEKNVEVTEKNVKVTEKNLEVTEKYLEVTEKNVEVTDINVEVKEKNATKKSVTSKKFKDLFGDNSDDSDFQSSFKPKKRKRFNLKTKANKRDTSINEDTNDDSTQNSQNTLEGTDSELPKNKIERKNKIEESFDKRKKTTKSNDDSSQNSLEGTDTELPKNKTEKKNKIRVDESFNRKKKSNDDSSQNSLEGTDTELPKNKTEKKNKIDESFDKKKKTKSNDDSSQNSLEGADSELPKNKSEKKNKLDESFDKNKKPKSNKDTTLKDHDQVILTPKTKLSKEDRIHKRVIDSQIDSDETPESTVKSRKKRKRSSSHNKKSPKINRKPRLYNSDSDDDFMEKPQREKKDIKKKINIPPPDPLNRIEHIRIRENKSYTIMHMNNISSYIKYYDNDVKRTESDDNQQTASQPAASNSQTSMILERKDYLNKGSQEISHNSETLSTENLGNSETTNITEFSNDVVETTSVVSDSAERIENSDTTNVVSDGFAGFSTNVESPRSAEIQHFRGNIFSNDIENSNSNDIEVSNFETSNFDDVETSNVAIETSNFAIETSNLNDIETSIEKQPPETVDGFENPDDPQSEMRRMLKLKSHLINQIKIKRDKLDSLKRIMAYKEEHNLDDLTKTTLQFKYTLREALVELLSHLKTHTERNFNMLLLLGFLKIPSEMVGYNDETKSFE